MLRAMDRLVVAMCTAGLAVACEQSETEILVIVESDLVPGVGMDRIDIAMSVQGRLRLGAGPGRALRGDD